MVKKESLQEEAGASSFSFSHLDTEGNATMVDVGGKQVTHRVAIATATVNMSEHTIQLLVQKALPKGDVLTTAKLAGIMAAKNTHHLIPLCHQLPLEYVDVRFIVDEEKSCIYIESEARTESRTGVEMEALVASQIAALTIYDMCKAVQKDIIITDSYLVHKTGGKSGDFTVTK